MQLPVHRYPWNRIARSRFRIDRAASGHQLPGKKQRANRVDQVFTKWRVEKHNIVGTAGATQESQGRHGVAAGRCAGLQYVQVIPDLAQGRFRGIHKVTTGSAPGQGLQAQCAAAGEQVQASGAVNARGQPVEQGFAHAVRGGPQAFCGGKPEFAASPLPANNAQGTLPCGVFAGSGHFVALCKGVRIVVFLQALACAYSSTTIMKFFKRKKAADEGAVHPELVPAADEAAIPERPVPADPAPGEPAGASVAPQGQATPQETTKPAVDSGGSEAAKAGFFSRLRRGLGRTSENLVQGMGTLFLGRKEIDEDLLEELESRLLLADVGVDATLEIIGRLTQRVSRKELTHAQGLQAALQEELLSLLKPCEQALDVGGKKPFVILMVGVNGVGKTTTIGKLAKRYQAEGRSVMLAAGDTFRAAAVEQLQVWGDRNGVPVIAQHTGADSASVLFDALQAAQARDVDVLIADTAGRLHNKDNLMEELKKVVRVLGKLDPAAPHEVMLVLDAGTGQNALAQAGHFQQWVGVSGISLTKLDGTAKGGVIFAIAKKLGLPIRYIGVGEAVDDLRPFQAQQFIDALFAGDDAAA